MRLIASLVALCSSLAVIVYGQSDSYATASVHVQAIGTSSIGLLAEVQYDATTLEGMISSYERPEIPEAAELVRVGTYDISKKRWSSSTTVTSVESFARGYSPIIVLSLDTNGGILSVAIQSAKVDAGQTRNFEPKVKVVGMTQGRTPELNKPVIVKDGKEEQKPEEKTLFQKYIFLA